MQIFSILSLLFILFFDSLNGADVATQNMERHPETLVISEFSEDPDGSVQILLNNGARFEVMTHLWQKDGNSKQNRGPWKKIEKNQIKEGNWVTVDNIINDDQKLMAKLTVFNSGQTFGIPAILIDAIPLNIQDIEVRGGSTVLVLEDGTLWEAWSQNNLNDWKIGDPVITFPVGVLNL